MMTSSDKKGQVILEKSVLYAVTVLAALVALLILYRMGVFSTFFIDSGIAGFSVVEVEDYVVSADNRIHLVLRNTGVSDVEIPPNNVYVKTRYVDCGWGGEFADGVDDLKQQEIKVYSVDCSGASPKLTSVYRVGDPYTLDVTIKYLNPDTGKTHESVGKVWGKLELETDVRFASTTTTTLKCREVDCDEPGTIDDDCTILDPTPGSEEPTDCTYCTTDNKCFERGNCGNACSTDLECEELPQGYDGINFCTECDEANQVCEEPEDPEDDCGLPCQDPETLSTDCEIDCEYCFKGWYGNYVCVEEGQCGQRCASNEECVDNIPRPSLGGRINICPWCDPTERICREDDCGKPCDPNNPNECQRNCEWCGPNIYGEYVCQEEEQQLDVEFIVHNESGGEFVLANELIKLNLTAKAHQGVDELWVSEKVKVEEFNYNCRDREIVVDGDKVEDIEIGDITDPLTDAPNIPWRIGDNPRYCDEGKCEIESIEHKYVWDDTESETGVNLCYWAIAREDDEIGEGRYSRIECDCIKIGILEVYLVQPKPPP
ncbi:MAG: hypothetical protein GF334_06860, partial [Candidatus Altiarchaeales archaeon]|nr:hypothetical protein [Candidatus Altiarchaeales archaeon]